VAETHPAAAAPHPGFLYGRIATVDGATYEGRLRWGGDQEAFWSDYFNGVKVGNPWVAHVPPARRPMESDPFKVFGVEIVRRQRPTDLSRRFMVRFGDITRIEAQGKRVRELLESGTGFDLERFEASDFDDGVRVWDPKRGVVTLDSLRIRKIELLPTSALGAGKYRLHGAVHTLQGDFTGFVQWDREEEVGTDELNGYTAKGASVIVHRNKELRQHQIFMSDNWLGGLYGSSGVLCTKGGGPIAAAWAVMNYLGEEGYLRLTRTALAATSELRAGLGEIGARVIAEPDMTLLNFTFDDADAFAVGDALFRRGWMADQQKPPPSLHCTVNAVHGPVIGDFLAALRESLAEVRASSATAAQKAYGALE
jgi:hypothetical protein